MSAEDKPGLPTHLVVYAQAPHWVHILMIAISAFVVGFTLGRAMVKPPTWKIYIEKLGDVPAQGGAGGEACQ